MFTPEFVRKFVNRNRIVKFVSTQIYILTKFTIVFRCHNFKDEHSIYLVGLSVKEHIISLKNLLIVCKSIYMLLNLDTA